MADRSAAWSPAPIDRTTPPVIRNAPPSVRPAAASTEPPGRSRSIIHAASGVMTVAVLTRKLALLTVVPR